MTPFASGFAVAGAVAIPFPFPFVLPVNLVAFVVVGWLVEASLLTVAEPALRAALLLRCTPTSSAGERPVSVGLL